MTKLGKRHNHLLLFSPHRGDFVFYLLLEDSNQFLVGVDQFLLFFDLSDDVVLSFEDREGDFNGEG